MRRILLTVLVIFLLGSVGFYLSVRMKNNITLPKFDTGNYLYEYAEGNCEKESDCSWAGEGCGGGHGVCTNTPEKYESMITTCDINSEFPVNKGYICTCNRFAKKCAWVK